MLYIVFTTGMCNLRYSYCGGSFPEGMVPWDVKYRVSTLIDFLSQDSDSTVAFYGGKPLLNVAFIRLVMDGVDARFVIQTNELLARRLEPECWTKFETVLLFVDSVEWLTDIHRYRGVTGGF